MSRPDLSVVIPFRDVERYLQQALDSVALQSQAGGLALDVILVDDASVDTSTQIAARWAAQHGARLITAGGNGAGAARNLGIAQAEGTAITFADGDDEVPPGAYLAMVEALRESGSDIAVGRVRRLSAAGTSRSTLHERAFHGLSSGTTHISRSLSLVYDPTVWNKTYRREFWDRSGLVFPEGRVFEDNPVALQAHVLAESVDLIDDVVYWWRVRPAGDPSVTQSHGGLATMADRLESVSGIDRWLRDRGELNIATEHDRKVLRVDLPILMARLDGASEQYQQVFMERSCAYLSHVDDSLIAELSPPAHRRIELIRNGRQTDLLRDVARQERRRRVIAPVRRVARGLARRAGVRR